jgi:hypothetical protein
LVNKTHYITSVIGIFHCLYPSGCAVALSSTQPSLLLDAEYQEYFLGVKAAGA